MVPEVESAYKTFLERAQAALGTVGAHQLIGPGAGPRWAEGWDLILAADNPGSSTLYAFAGEDSNQSDTALRLDTLASGLAESGVLSQGPVNLVTVTTLQEPDPRRARAALKLAPRTYYGNLRPFAWVVDLASGELISSRRPGQPEGRQELRSAADRTSAAVDLDTMVAAQQRHGEQLQAFRRLVQGRQPIVTYILIAANVAMFLVVSAAPGDYTSNLPRFGALIPERVLHGEWWRLISAMFLHAGVAHILFNMISLFVVGSLAERLYGSVKFLAIYLGSGLTASLAGFAYSIAVGDLLSPHVGASGAIFGIAGALITLRFQRTDVIPLSVRARISSSMLVLVLLNLVVLTFTPNIDNAAHIGGLLGGMALSFVFPLTRRLPNEVAR